MKFYNVKTKRPTNVPNQKVKYVSKTVDTRSPLGVRKITFAKAKSGGQKLSKIVSSKRIRKSPSMKRRKRSRSVRKRSKRKRSKRSKRKRSKRSKRKRSKK